MFGKYVSDLTLLHKIRSFKDGITFFELALNLDLYKADHKPAFTFHLIVLNWMIFEFEVFNKYHLEDEDEDSK